MRRWTLRVLCWLVIGAVVNVAVIWSGIWFVMPFGWDAHGMKKGPTQEWLIPAYASNNWPPPYFGDEWWVPGFTRQDVFTRAVPPDPEAQYFQIIESFGWPARSLRVVLTKDGSETTPVYAVREGWLLVSTPQEWHKTRDCLPMHPIWPGFLWDAMFYGALSAFSWHGPGQVRRWRRRGKGPGHCAKCGYDLTGLAPGNKCPECGKASTNASLAQEKP